MEKTINFRRDRIIKIETYIDRPRAYCEYKEYQKRRILPDIKEGVYEWDAWRSGQTYKGTEPPKNCIIKNQNVLYKPHMEVYTMDKDSCTVYFETEEELLDAAEDLKNETGADWHEF
jgi:hypothetical protein